MRALVAFAVGMVPQLPNLAYQINPMIKGVSRNYVSFSSLGWLEGFLFSAWVSTFKSWQFGVETDEETQVRLLYLVLIVSFSDTNE